MIISKVRLKQFRNIREQIINFNSGLNIFYGSNGQGKTNLIEAIYLLTHGTSFRTNDMCFLVNKSDFLSFYLKSEFLKKNIHHKVNVVFLGEKKLIKINERKTTMSNLRKNFSSILFSPETLQIIKDSDKKRRELIDNLCLHLFSDFSNLYNENQRLLKQKTSLLKKMKERQVSFNEGKDLNQLLSLEFLRKSSQICFFRLEAIRKIEGLLSEKFFEIINNYKGNLSIEYTISNRNFSTEKREAIFDAMYKEWRENEKREINAGRCLIGPHKHGIKFEFEGKDARFFCSQGQQRAIMLAFKIAQMELYHEVHKDFPILLLDDVLSELDKKKQMNFLENLLSTKSQIFLTTTEPMFIGEKRQLSIFKTEEGFFNEKETFPERGLSV